jgi:hypothetical protein
MPRSVNSDVQTKRAMCLAKALWEGDFIGIAVLLDRRKGVI